VHCLDNQDDPLYIEQITDKDLFVVHDDLCEKMTKHTCNELNEPTANWTIGYLDVVLMYFSVINIGYF